MIQTIVIILAKRENSLENGKYIVFYSGTNNELHHGIGMVYGTEMNKLKKVNIDFTDKDNAKMKVDRILGR